MAKEALYVPEEYLEEVISVIRNGLKATTTSISTRVVLTRWCNEEEEYLKRLG